ncbi:outer membrane beta-barrel protein [Thiothrix winogradskyi]|uniref:Porin family protein n=1 Tax=Thiothrix winogradskyi TaxID=96472 RepID=A0ABY3SVS7_9GAMM|nr:outer membrane beta-barrel protein [Thiothrix winogradskyi]UJS22913.1 porin family protein [Thiothrix winogradskyi]
MKLSYLIGLISLSVAPSITFANDIFSATEADSGMPGQFYAGFSLLKSDAECNYEGVACDSTGYKIATGYKFNDNFAVEGGYYDLFTNDGTNATTGEKSTVNGSGLALSTIGTYSIDGKSSLSGKVGFMAWDAEANKAGVPVVGMSGTDILLGVGAGYRLNDHWQLRGEYEQIGGDLEAKVYSLGTTLSTL